MGPGQSPFPPYPFIFPPSTLSFSIFHFFFLSFLTRFIHFLAFASLPNPAEYSHSFPGRMLQEKTNPGFSFFCSFYVRPRMRALFAVFDLVLSCGVIIVSFCCRRWRNNLRLDPFPFLGGC